MDNKKTELITKIKIFLFFIYLLVYYMYGADPNKVKYSEIILIIFIALEGIRIIRTKRIVYCIPIIVLFIFSFYCFLSSFWAIDANKSIKMSETLMILSAFTLLGYNFFSELNNGQEYLLKIIMYAGFVFSICIILYYGIENYFSKLLNGERVGGEINNVNAIGMELIISFIIFLFYALNENKKRYLLLSILPLIVSLGTGSREVILAIISGMILMFLLKNDNKLTFNKSIKYLFMFVIIVFILIRISRMPMFSTIFERVNSTKNIFTQNGKIDRSTNIRQTFIKEGLNQFLKTPILGIGIANSGYLTVKAGYWHTYLHNNYVELLACGGIVGFSLYYSNYIYILHYCFKYKKQQNKHINILLIILIIALLMDLGTVSYYDKVIYIYFMFGFITIRNMKTIKQKGEN